MKAYLRNIKEAWKIYKDGRWPSNSMNIYRFIFKYTIKYIQRNVVLNYLNKN